MEMAQHNFSSDLYIIMKSLQCVDYGTLPKAIPELHITHIHARHVYKVSFSP